MAITVGELRRVLESAGLGDDKPVKVYLDLYNLDEHTAVLRRVEEERSVKVVDQALVINVGHSYTKRDFEREG
jgi:hypothetical protein